jgi:hypothetical protein
VNLDLSQQIFTTEDFDNMGWHDCRIHAISFGKDFKMLFDIDYIFKWVQTGKTFKFWVAPCTLIFENCYDINMDLSIPEFDIDIISRENPKKPNNAEYIGELIEFDWFVDSHQGGISFKSVGFKQYVRRSPLLIPAQYFELDQRGGISFSLI